MRPEPATCACFGLCFALVRVAAQLSIYWAFFLLPSLFCPDPVSLSFGIYLTSLSILCESEGEVGRWNTDRRGRRLGELVVAVCTLAVGPEPPISVQVLPLPRSLTLPVLLVC